MEEYEELDEYFQDEPYVDEQGNPVNSPSMWSWLLPNVLNPGPVNPVAIPNQQGDKLSGAENVMLLVVLGTIISVVIIAIVLLRKK